MPAPSAATLIAKKRDGKVLSASEIEALIEGFTAGRVADYQMSAFAMAVYLRGMTPRETSALTLAMRDSGHRANLGAIDGPKVDKHSTGGVGDKVSLALAPLVAACGVNVPMISGRGLGHTGGTLDKLEAIEGFRVNLSLSKFERLVKTHGVAMIGQTQDLAPADRRLYALRDVTATVESIPLITASILSKKLAEDLDALVLDVKVGRGAFMKRLADARALAKSIQAVGSAVGTPVTTVLTRMECPLGAAVGNALETAEALALLEGEGPDDLRECTLTLGAEMLRAAGVAKGRDAEQRLLRALADGSAVRRMEAVVRAQGGDPRVVRERDRLPRAPHRSLVGAPVSGYVRDVDALAVGELAMRLGAGRTRTDEPIDPAVGVVLRKKPGDAVAAGEALAELHLSGREQARWARPALSSAIRVGSRRPRAMPLVLEVRRPRGR